MTNYVSNIVHNGVEYTIKDSNATNEINNIKAQLTNVNSSGGHQIFDIVMKDHILSYEETKGLAPLGTYVYKEAIAGTRYGYPDFYQKCVDEYNESTSQSEYVSSNYVQMVGTITDNEGVLSGFSNGNYILGGYINIPTGATWEYVTKFNSSDHSTTNILGGFGNEGMHSLSTDINTDGTLSVFITSNSSNWDIANGARSSLTLNDNTDYYMKRYFTGTEYKVDISTTGAFSGEETNYITVNSTTSIFSTNCPVDIAGWMANGTFLPFRGTIDLNGCYININGERWWTGTTRRNHKIYSNRHRFYDIADKSIYDNMYAITGEAWYYGIDTTNERIFLPRSTRFKHGTSSDVGEYQAPGLPNILASFKPFITNGSSGTGAIRTTRLQNWTTTGGTGELDRAQADFDASLSNSIYGASDTVEYSSTKLIPYMCVGDTESSDAAIDVIDITTSENDTLPLGFSTYQGEGTQPSPAWLKSSGQWNSGEVYTTFYNYYLDKIGDDFGAGKVVENTDPYTDYDLVINQTDETFRLPLLNGSEDLPGSADNRTVLTLGASGDTYTQTKNGYYELSVTSNVSYWYLENTTTGICSGATNAGNGYTSRLFVKAKKNDVVKVLYQLAPTSYDFYFVPAVGNGDLFYKVANAVQNLELLDAGEVLEAVNDLIHNNSSLIASYAMPSSTYVDLTLGASGSTYTAPANGWFYFDGGSTSGNRYIDLLCNNMSVKGITISGVSNTAVILPVKKGDNVQVNYNINIIAAFRFIYAQGSESET